MLKKFCLSKLMNEKFINFMADHLGQHLSHYTNMYVQLSSWARGVILDPRLHFHILCVSPSREAVSTKNPNPMVLLISFYTIRSNSVIQ